MYGDRNEREHASQCAIAPWPTFLSVITGIVLEPLAHLPSVGRKHETVDDEVLESGLVEQRGRQHRQGVEPSPCLPEKIKIRKQPDYQQENLRDDENFQKTIDESHKKPFEST